MLFVSLYLEVYDEGHNCQNHNKYAQQPTRQVRLSLLLRINDSDYLRSKDDVHLEDGAREIEEKS